MIVYLLWEQFHSRVYYYDKLRGIFSSKEKIEEYLRTHIVLHPAITEEIIQ